MDKRKAHLSLLCFTSIRLFFSSCFNLCYVNFTFPESLLNETQWETREWNGVRVLIEFNPNVDFYIIDWQLVEFLWLNLECFNCMILNSLHKPESSSIFQKLLTWKPLSAQFVIHPFNLSNRICVKCFHLMMITQMMNPIWGYNWIFYLLSTFRWDLWTFICKINIETRTKIAPLSLQFHSSLETFFIRHQITRQKIKIKTESFLKMIFRFNKLLVRPWQCQQHCDA